MISIVKRDKDKDIIKIKNIIKRTVLKIALVFLTSLIFNQLRAHKCFLVHQKTQNYSKITKKQIALNSMPVNRKFCIAPMNNWRYAIFPDGDVGWIPKELDLPQALFVNFSNDSN